MPHVEMPSQEASSRSFLLFANMGNATEAVVQSARKRPRSSPRRANTSCKQGTVVPPAPKRCRDATTDRFDLHARQPTARHGAKWLQRVTAAKDKSRSTWSSKRESNACESRTPRRTSRFHCNRLLLSCCPFPPDKKAVHHETSKHLCADFWP
jgi:hypothetical protein